MPKQYNMKNMINNKMTEQEDANNKKLPEHGNIRGKLYYQTYKKNSYEN